MQSKATTVAAYLKELPEDRRKALEAIRKVIKQNLDPAFEEGMQYGMIGYYLPHSVYPAGYHCDPKQPLPFASLASQKNHMAIYLFCVYTEPDEPERFAQAWKAAGKKLDMGKSCVRFKKLEDVALDVLGDAIRRSTAKKFVATYEAHRDAPREPMRRSATKQAVKKTAPRASAVKKVAKKASTKKAARRRIS